MKLQTRLLLSCTGAALIGFPSPAASQGLMGGVATIEELVVTAEKRTQSLQDVPVAITAFTSEKRDLIGILSVNDIANFTPGLEYNPATDRTTLRGVGRLTNVHAADSSVAQYADGLYTSSTVDAGKSPIFVDRVEVLRGPQGTLYGRNSIGGAINIISRRPTEDFYAEVRARYENYESFALEGATSGPTAIAGVQFRLAASVTKQSHGWFANVVPGMPDEGGVTDQKYAEGQLQLKLNETFEGWVKLEWAQQRGRGRNDYTPAPFTTEQTGSPGFYIDAGYACRPNTGVSDVRLPPGMSLAKACSNPAVTDARKFSSLVPASSKLNDTWILASEFTFHLDGMDLKYIGGGTHYDYRAILSSDGPAILGFTLPNFAGGPAARIRPRVASEYRETLSWQSHELNLASTDAGPFQWIGGLYYFRETYDQPTGGVLLDQAEVNGPFLTGDTCVFTGGVCPATAGANRFYDNRPHVATKSQAAYGQIDWSFRPRWKATIGLRYTRDNKRGYESGRILCLDVAVCTASASNPTPFQTGFPPEILGNFLVDLTQLPNTVVFGQLPGGPGAPGVAKGVSSLTTIDPTTGFATRRYNDHWSALTGTAGLQWDPTPDTMAYARYSRGYKAGGFNIGNGAIIGENPSTDPEHVNAVEVGLKKSFGRTFQANLAIFHYDYRDAQVPIQIVPTSGGLGTTQSVFFNLPRSISQGVELETIWQPVERLQILANYSYLDAHVSKARGIVDPVDPTASQPGARPNTPGGTCLANPTLSCDVFTGLVSRGQDLSGASLPNAPRNKVAINISYTVPLEPGALTGSVSYIWRGRQYGSVFNRSYFQAPAWDQWDARLSFTDREDRYTLVASIKNIFDDLGYAGGAVASRRAGFVPAYVLGGPGLSPVPGLQGIASTYPLTPPRTYGVELQVRF